MAGHRRNPTKPLPTATDDHERQLLASVAEHGWQVLAIPADAEGPAFAYSVGLVHSFDHPEIIVVGLDVAVMHGMIDAIGQRVRDGEQFEHLHEYEDVVEGFNVQCRTMARRHYPEYLGFAHWFYRGEDFPVLQCCWPDAQHRYPWHPQRHPDFAARQPVLSDDTSWPFHEGTNRAAFTTAPVLADTHPILLVTHDHDGDWQFLCGTTLDTDDARVVSLGEIVRKEPTLAELADLPEGWSATRADAGGAWMREAMPEDDAEAEDDEETGP